MARVRVIEIENFRGIKKLRWCPKDGINCLIGSGDSCKTTILDAIDLCLTSRRNVQFSDGDFHVLDVDQPITIRCTLGALDDGLKSIDAYGLYLRGFNPENGEVEDEPARGFETVLTLSLIVNSDLEPSWTLESTRAAAQNLTRNLSWADRQRVSPTRIGASPDQNLVWRRGSILNKLSDEQASASTALLKAGRDARAAFGDQAGKELQVALAAVGDAARDLGIPVGREVKAMLDANSVSFNGGSISLHSEVGIPLRALGTGSTRLLIAGLQRKASSEASVLLVDELEHGLEPHRILRFLHSLGSKEVVTPMQAFLTTHSPVAVQELSGSQLWVVRYERGHVSIQSVGIDDDIQSTVRCYPEAFLARSIVVCEGASEVGLLRGVDQWRVSLGQPSLMAMGVALIDAGGVTKIYKRANALVKLGYRCIVLRDDDEQPDAGDEKQFMDSGGELAKWSNNRNLEQELFSCLSEEGVERLLEYAEELYGEAHLDNHIRTTSHGRVTYGDIQSELLSGWTEVTRELLGKASSMRKSGWFKSVTWMEEASRRAVGPTLDAAKPSLRDNVSGIWQWAAG